MNDIMEALKYSNNLYARIILALASTLYAVFTMFGPPPDAYVMVDGYAKFLPVPPYHNWQVILIFGINAALLWWRIFDSKPRIVAARLINYLNALLWVLVCLFSIFVYGEPLADNAGKIVLTLVSLHMLTRTDYNFRDRGSA